jgi:hypothetical protein
MINFTKLASMPVKLLMHILEVWIGHVRVNLGGGDVAVAEHGLHAAQVGAVHEQVGGERVAHGVR